ncbi:MAG: hypothetical protein FJW38_01740 [Acidobacteria bacterium]|nr:hypothetical protein [Acidobacteriota bacterium]MBM3768435.1 hypothetical protein [Acidobacteriota bacterium]
MLRPVLFVAIFGGAVFAQHDAESMHINNMDLVLNKRTTVQMHMRFRTRDAFREFFQFRFGPILQYRVNKNVVGIAGYYFLNQNYPNRQPAGWRDYNRYFGGAVFTLKRTRRTALEQRLLIERFHLIPGGDFNRVRTRTSLAKTSGTWLPFSHFEVLRSNDRWYFRSGLVMNRRMNRTTAMGLGYEVRLAPDRSWSHIVSTTVLFQPQRKE